MGVSDGHGDQTERSSSNGFSESKNGLDLESDGSEKQVNGNGLRKSTGREFELIVKNGSVRHFLAIMALSAIVMANMNRQAYNQALVRMIRKSSNKNGASPEPLDAVAGAPITLPPVSMPPPSESSGQETFTTIYSEPLDPIPGEVPAGRLNPSPEGEQDVAPEGRVEGDQDGFDWTGSQISLLQAGFSYGYTFFMIPGGRLSEIYGSKWVVFVSGFGSALCSTLTPFIAGESYALLVASRIFMGLCQTGISPALYAFCTRWLPPDESSVYLPLIKVGVMIGFMMGSLINGFLPWRVMFYVVGAAGFLWSLLWACFATSEPHEHRLISRQELAYIQHALEQRRAQERKPGDSGDRKRSSSAPWLGILTNPVVVAFTLTKFTVKLSTDNQTTQLPMYMRNVFDVDDKLNGVLNGANFAIQACLTGAVAYTAKEMVLRRPFGLTKTGVRVLFQGINCFGMGLAYFLISMNMGSLELVCCAVITLSVASMFGSGGEAVLPVDLTTEYAASIMAIANSFANLSGIVMPTVVSFLLDNQLTNSTRWNHVWWFVSATMCCGGLIFSFFVRAEIQDFRGGGKKGTMGKEKPADKSLNSRSVDKTAG